MRPELEGAGFLCQNFGEFQLWIQMLPELGGADSLDTLECKEEAALLWKRLDKSLDRSEDETFQSYEVALHRENHHFA